MIHSPPLLFAAGLAWLALATGRPALAEPPTCLVQITSRDPALKDVAVERIQTYFPGPVDVLHGSGALSSASAAHDLTVVLGEDDSDPRLSALWAGNAARDSDSYRIKTLSTSPRVIAVSGRGPRGTLYAAYQLAELLETKADLSALEVDRAPQVKRRYAMLGASSFGGAYERNLLYLKELKELPRYGFNGVSILGYDDGNTPAGHTGPPFLIRKDAIVPIPSQIAEWHLLLKEIKRYGLDVALILPPLFPGEYQASDIVRHYSGEAPIPGYNRQLEKFFSNYLRTCSDTFPELDAVFLLNWEYPANLGAQMFTFNTRIDRYRYGPRDPRISAEVLETYAQTLETFGRERKKAVGYLVHLAGVHQADIRAMHQVLFRHPELIKIEPPFFPDTGWPYLSLFGDWPADLKKDQLFAAGRWGMLMTTTTGQYYGGGSLPTSFPDPFVNASRQAVANRADTVMMLLDMWDATALGNLFDIDEILPLAAARQLWTPEATLDEIWKGWTIRRFGPKAGPRLEGALRSSGTIIRDGLTLEGVGLMVHGAIRSESWRAPGLRLALFGTPGTPVVAPSADGYPNTDESMAAQMNARAVAMPEFRRLQQAALAAAVAGAQAVETARPDLSAADYLYLRAVFRDSQVILRAISLIGEAAHATNVALGSPSGAEPSVQFDRALGRLMDYAEQVKDYHATLPEQNERSTSGLVIDPSLSLTLKTIARGFAEYVQRTNARSSTK